MIRLITRFLRRLRDHWRATDPKQPLPLHLFPTPEKMEELLRRIRMCWRQGKPEQIAPKVFACDDEDGDDGYVSFHRHSDGIPVAIARAKAFVTPPHGCYAAPLANGDVSLYRCTLPELQPTP